MAQLYSRNGRFITLAQIRMLEKKEKGKGAGEKAVIETEKANKLVDKAVKEKKVKEVQVYKCSICGKVCKSQWHLDKHLKSHEVKEEIAEAEQMPVTKEKVEEIDKILE